MDAETKRYVDYHLKRVMAIQVLAFFACSLMIGVAPREVAQLMTLVSGLAVLVLTKRLIEAEKEGEKQKS